MAKNKTDKTEMEVEEIEEQPHTAGPILPQTRTNWRDRIPPRMNIVQGTSSSYIRRGGKPGHIFLDLPEHLGGPRNAEQIRIVLVDGDLPGRVMFPYDPESGKPSTPSDGDNQPWCGSSDGINPRGTFVGKQYVDHRNGFIVTINEGFADPFTGRAAEYSGCANCPLGSWSPSLRDKKTGEYLLDPKTGKKQKGKPPCQESPSFVFYALDPISSPLLMQAMSFSIRAALVGNKAQNELGVAWYYTQPQKRLETPHPVFGEWTRPVFDGKNYFPLLMTVSYKPNSFGGSYIPSFAVDKTPLTDEEVSMIYGGNGQPSLYDLYLAPGEDGFSTRDYLTGKAFGAFQDDDDDDMFALSSGQQIDPEKAALLLGQGDRRIDLSETTDAPF